MTLRPNELGPQHVAAVRTAGVSDGAIVDAVLVCALFNTIDRIADALGFEVPPEALQRDIAPLLLQFGYSPGAKP
jgi:alkylhydroperoxidase family enzyme